MIILFVLSLFLSAQVDTAWVRRYNGPGNGYDVPYAIAVDHSSNVYVSGYSIGVGTQQDFVTIKYSPDGQVTWIQTYNGPGNGIDVVNDMAVDNAGNVYVTGWSDGVGSYSDYVTIKYYPNGDTAWIRRYNGPGNSNDSPNAIAVDNAGNVYVSGGCWGGTGTSYDITTIKYNPNGTTAWIRRYNGPGSSADWAWDMTFDNAGFLYVAGGSMGSGTYYDYITIKYDSDGDTIWLRNYNGPGNNNDVINRMTVEDDNDVLVTGYSLNASGNFDFATVKYNSAGNQMWVIRYDGTGNDNDYANAIAVDNAGYVYITGNSTGSGTEYDYATIKYNDLIGIGGNHLPLSARGGGIEIYPNPAYNYFNILLPRYKDDPIFRVFNVAGEIIKEFACKNQGTECRVPLTGINPGVYFVQISGESTPKKIIVTK